MSPVTRRRLCRTAAVLLSGAIAGCVSSSSDVPPGVLAPGQAGTIDDVEIAYTGYEIVGSARPASATPAAERAETSTASPQAPGTNESYGTPVTATGDERLVAVRFRIRNVGGTPKPAPMPRPAPVIAKGELTLAIEDGEQRTSFTEGRWRPSSVGIGPRLAIDGRTVGSLAHRLGQRRAELAPGETVTGWAVYPLLEGMALADLRVVLGGVEIEMDLPAHRTEVTWYLVEQ